jgi:hypothetical protein
VVGGEQQVGRRRRGCCGPGLQGHLQNTRPFGEKQPVM